MPVKMTNELYKHIFLNGPTQTPEYSSPWQSPRTKGSPARMRAIHASLLEKKLKAAWDAADQKNAMIRSARNGIYLDFYGEPGYDLTVKSLNNDTSSIRLLGVVEEGQTGKEVIRATVFVPDNKKDFFFKKIREYATEIEKRSKTNAPKNATLIESISDIQLSNLESFWHGKKELLPGDFPDWVEAWLNTDDAEALESFKVLCSQIKIEVGEEQINFPERTVFIIKANRAGLARLIELSDSIAEFRTARAVTGFFLGESNISQAEWVKDLLERTTFQDHEQVAVLLLDHGVNNGHPLLRQMLSSSDRHAVNPEWGHTDDHGHGTLMAGTAAYGNLADVLTMTSRLIITHSLESAKILPPPRFGVNPKQLWGHFTAQGIYRAEIQSPERKRIICMAVTAPGEQDLGRPSSWSGKIDELASGFEDDNKRLIIISAGNVDEPDDWNNYPEANLTREVHDPAQSWNALSVGAYTAKVKIEDPHYKGFTPVASRWNLSPYSTTSLTWPSRRWPIKPEVLFEGGNLAYDQDKHAWDPDDLQLLSTHHNPQKAHFARFHATSAAAAQAAWMAAKIQSAYPDAWPETIRGLVVHAARWTRAQMDSFLDDESKASYARLLRICGYGVISHPDRALYCASNSLTLIAQELIQPFSWDDSKKRYVTNNMHLYRLPWPKKELLDLGEEIVTMRVTLSYFVEPSPAEIGWQDRYRYASHGLRFQLNGSGESEEEFIQRINTLTREEIEYLETQGASGHWRIGEARNVGSIHSDYWAGTAAELAASNLIAVHPIIGWWRERPHLGRGERETRYSLMVSIRLKQNIDIYTPVAAQIGIKTPTPVSISIG